MRLAALLLPVFVPVLCGLAPATQASAQAARKPAPVAPKPFVKATAVLLFDGKLPEQVALEAATREAFGPHTAKVDLRTMHAGRAETVPFLRKYHLTRANAPVLLVLDEPGPRARIIKRVPLKATDDVKRSLRQMLAALKLPLPAADPPPPGPLVTIRADGEEAEKKHLVAVEGKQRVEGGVRVLDHGASVTYRFPIPELLKTADLALELGGAFHADWASAEDGPWSTLVDSNVLLPGAAGRVQERLRPVLDVSPIVKELPASLYVRVKTIGLTRGRAEVAGLQLVARAASAISGEKQWLVELEALRTKYQATLPSGIARSTPLGGIVEKDRILTAEESPYVLLSDLLVPLRRKLTIEAGVSIKVGGKYVIQVFGDLVARGTQAKPIVFEPLSPRQPDDWNGIEWVANRGYFAGERSGMAHCVIRNAMRVHLPRFAGEIRSTTFEHCLLGVGITDGGKGKLHHNRFLGCVRGMLVDGGAGEVTDNEWVDCLVALAVSGVHATAPFRFTQNSIVGSRQAAVNYTRQPNRPVPLLTLENNYWGNTAPNRMIGGGAKAEDVRFEPRLPEPPPGVGPGSGA
jgi:hypothetical protein